MRLFHVLRYSFGTVGKVRHSLVQEKELRMKNEPPTARLALIPKPVGSTVALLALLAGCTATNPIVRPADTDSVIDFAKRLQVQTSDQALRMIPKIYNETKQREGFRTFSGWWCPDHAEVKNEKDVQERIAQFCGYHGGSYNGHWCRDKKDETKVLFAALFVWSQNCGSAPAVEVLIAEPDKGAYTAEYASFLLRYR